MGRQDEFWTRWNLSSHLFPDPVFCPFPPSASPSERLRDTMRSTSIIATRGVSAATRAALLNELIGIKEATVESKTSSYRSMRAEKWQEEEEVSSPLD